MYCVLRVLLIIISFNHHNKILWHINQLQTAGIAWLLCRPSTGWTIRFSTLGGGRDFMDQSRPVSRPTQPPVQEVPRLFQWRKAAKHGVEYSPLSRAEVEESVEPQFCPPPLPPAAQCLFDKLRYSFTLTNYIFIPHHFILRDFALSTNILNPFTSIYLGVGNILSINYGLQLRYRLTLRSLTLYIYGAPILAVSRSHTTTQHSR